MAAHHGATPDGSAVFDWIDRHAEQRDAAGLTRVVRARTRDETALDLASNDYLALSRHPDVVGAAAEAARVWGAGSTGSRLVTGTTRLHTELEAELAAHCGTEAALVFSSGYAANLALLSTLAGPGTLIVSDAHNHASLIDACRLSRAEVAITPHADPEAVDRTLSGRRQAAALVVTESVYSVDGDTAPLDELHRVCRAHGAALLTDDAHGLGIIGPSGAGALTGCGIGDAPDAVATVTLSKALGAQGGAVLGPRRVVDHLAQSARTFVFDTGLAPACAGAALAALRLVRSEPERSRNVRGVAERLYAELTAAGLTVGEPGAAVLAVPAGGPERAVEWAEACLRRGVRVGCFRPPSVPDASSRLRLTARADLTRQRIGEVVRTIAAAAPARCSDR